MSNGVGSNASCGWPVLAIGGILLLALWPDLVRFVNWLTG